MNTKSLLVDAKLEEIVDTYTQAITIMAGALISYWTLYKRMPEGGNSADIKVSTLIELEDISQIIKSKTETKYNCKVELSKASSSHDGYLGTQWSRQISIIVYIEDTPIRLVLKH